MLKKKVQVDEHSPIFSATCFSDPRESHSCPPPPYKTLQDQQVGLDQVPMKSPLCSVSWCAWDLGVPFKSGVSVSPCPVELLWSSPAGLQSQMLWGLFLVMSDSQAGEPHMGLRNLTPVGEILNYNYSPLCVSLSRGVWDLIISWACPSYCLILVSSLSLDVEYLF